MPPTGPRTESGSSSPKRRRGRPDGRRTTWLFRFDQSFERRFVAGADEAGRGSLAGPLVAAAVLLDYECLGPAERKALAGLDDSKRKTEEERERLYPAVLAAASRVAVTARCAGGIDSRGLHVTNLNALADCLGRVAVPGAKCLSDGFRLGSRCSVEHEAVVDGDARSAAIAAASVIAKVTRDRYMRRAEGIYPGWDFAGNVGYSTPGHREAIGRIGISGLHRRSFASTAYHQLELGA
ncbi:MAG: ribonuclease HII [Solirubrobacterales bacterium]|nr:ribonuclease HII [Solirubrobacterales bacterium]